MAMTIPLPNQPLFFPYNRSSDRCRFWSHGLATWFLPAASFAATNINPQRPAYAKPGAFLPKPIINR
jgi:hypothetical protein